MGKPLELLTFNLGETALVIRAENGQQAIDMIEHIQIFQYRLDEPRSGIDVCRTLRGRLDTKRLPIIILGARGEEGDRTLGLELELTTFSDVFAPGDDQPCIGRLHVRTLGCRGHIEFHDLRFNQLNMEVTRGGHPVSLGPKESRLLAFLMERPAAC